MSPSWPGSIGAAKAATGPENNIDEVSTAASTAWTHFFAIDLNMSTAFLLG